MEVKNYSRSIAEVSLCTVHRFFFSFLFLRRFVFVLFPLRASLIGSPNLFLESKQQNISSSLITFSFLFVSSEHCFSPLILFVLSCFCLSNVSKQSIAKVTHCTLVSSEYKLHFHKKKVSTLFFFFLSCELNEVHSNNFLYINILSFNYYFYISVLI